MIYFLTDIDDTLMQTALKMEKEEGRYSGAVDAEGKDLSFKSESQKQLIELYQSNAEVIPVTGRSSWAMDRVSLKFSSLKVVSHGAIILDHENKPLHAWMDSIEREVEQSGKFLTHCFSVCDDLIKKEVLEVNLRCLEDHGVPVYLSFKGSRGSRASIEHLNHIETGLKGLCQSQEGRWRIHRNGRNMALLPPYTCKKRACDWLIDHVAAESGKDLFITAGDSVSDIPFMKSGHIMMIPSKSQIVDQNFA
jgi:hydroxymethylpyrimidine pyrophosphatase-like HAD family hydrolase